MSDAGRVEIVVEVVTLDGIKIACVRPEGEIDLSNAEELGAALSSPQTDACAGTLVDLREVDFMDSSGLRVMLMNAREGGGRFATIIREDSAVANLFEMVDVGERLNVMPTEDEALAKIRAGADDGG